MHASRFVSLVSKPLLSSFCPRVSSFSQRVVPISCRKISTGKDHLKLGNVGGKMKAKDHTRDLDVFTGRWVQQSVKESRPGGRDQDTAMPITFENDVYKPYVSYTRSNGTWHVQLGFVDRSMDIFYKFKFGEDFVFMYPDNTLSRIVVYQHGDHMKWIFQPLNPDCRVPPRQEDTVHQTTKVVDGKLIVKTEHPDKVTKITTYIRDLQG